MMSSDSEIDKKKNGFSSRMFLQKNIMNGLDGCANRRRPIINLNHSSIVNRRVALIFSIHWRKI